LYFILSEFQSFLYLWREKNERGFISNLCKELRVLCCALKEMNEEQIVVIQ
jgi:hypothetical protein